MLANGKPPDDWQNLVEESHPQQDCLAALRKEKVQVGILHHRLICLLSQFSICHNLLVESGHAEEIWYHPTGYINTATANPLQPHQK